MTLPLIASPASGLRPAPNPGLVGFLVGDLASDPAAAAKYGLLFRSLEQLYGSMRAYDLTLRGLDRLRNGLLTFHPDRRTWRERYFKSPGAFASRSRHARNIIHALRAPAGAIIQIGALFDAAWDQPAVPVVMYTDYTARLSADDPYRFRSPFSARQLHQRIEYERQAYMHAAHIFTRSLIVRRDIVDRYGISAEHVSVVGGGVNLAQLPAPIERSSTEGTVILFVGSDFVRKGGDLLLRAFAVIRQELPAARLRVLTRAAIPRGLPLENVEVIPHRWDRELLARLYAEADVFVLPARLETWGDVILEAAAYGLPCIGTRGQPMEEIIKDGETGLLIHPDNMEDLAKALRRLLNNADLRRRLGAAARIRTLTEFTWDAVVQRMVPMLDWALAGSSSNVASHPEDNPEAS